MTYFHDVYHRLHPRTKGGSGGRRVRVFDPGPRPVKKAPSRYAIIDAIPARALTRLAGNACGE